MTRNSQKKILVVDDDRQLLKEVKAHLGKFGYEVVTAENASRGLELARSASPDLVVLDITYAESGMPKNRIIDGLDVLRQLRESSRIPVLMLSSTNISSVKVMALSLGADDYLSKPFDLHELSARVEAVLRRAGHAPQEEKVLRFRSLQLDPGERRVWKQGKSIELTGIEFDILYALARRPGHVFTRDKLMESAWKNDRLCVPKAVDVHIGHIRKKIEDDPSVPRLLVTVRGVGYRFEDVPE